MDLNFRKPEEIVKSLSERLRQERIRRQFTQAELAQRAGVGVNTVSNLEAGRNVGFEVVVRVAWCWVLAMSWKTCLCRNWRVWTIFAASKSALRDSE
nr:MULTISPECIES: helix-turn-helix domain-containing protein [unclassified Leclercia]